MAKTASDRTFTGVLLVCRDETGGRSEYDVFAGDDSEYLGSTEARRIHRAFPGIAKLFPKPCKHTVSRKRRVRVTIEVLPDESETPTS